MAGQRISVLQRARMQREMRKESRTGKMRNSMKQTEQRMKTRWILAFLAMLVCFCGWWAVRKEGFLRMNFILMDFQTAIMRRF